MIPNDRYRQGFITHADECKRILSKVSPETRDFMRQNFDVSLYSAAWVREFARKLEAFRTAAPEAPQRARTHDADGDCTRCGERWPNHHPNCIHFEYEAETQRLAAPEAQPVKEGT